MGRTNGLINRWGVMDMNSQNRMRSRVSFIGIISLIVLFGAFGIVEPAFAAPLLQESSPVWWAVLERMIVIAGATLLLGVWGKWRERRNNKQD